MLATLLLALAPAQQGWSALPLPSLSQPAPSGPAPATLRDAGSHIELEPGRRRPTAPEAGFVLPIPSLIELLEADARRAGTELRLLRTAPPLLARGSAEGLARARALLEELDRAGTSHQIELEVTLAAAGEPPASYFQRVRSGERVRFGTRSTRGFLADFEVDVATGGGTADPVFGSVLEGELLDLRTWRTPDGAAAFVVGELDLAELVDIATADPDSDDLGRVDVPTVRSVVVRFAGLVEGDAPLRLEVSGAPLSKPDWTVTIAASTEPDRPATWRVADLAWLESAPDPLELPNPGAGLAFVPPSDRGPSALEPLSSSILWGELEASFGARRGERPLFALAPGVLVAPTSDERIWPELDSMLAAAQASRSTTRPVEVRAGGLVVRTTVAEGLELRVQSGEERTALVDFDTEIAPEYWMAEPRVERVFDGVLVQARLAGSELLGSWWESSSDAPRVLGRDATVHGSVSLPSRRLRSGPVRVAVGTDASLSSGIRIAIDVR